MPNIAPVATAPVAVKPKSIMGSLDQEMQGLEGTSNSLQLQEMVNTLTPGREQALMHQIAMSRIPMEAKPYLAIIMSENVRMTDKPADWSAKAVDPWALSEAARVSSFILQGSIAEDGAGRTETGNMITNALKMTLRRFMRRGPGGDEQNLEGF